MFNKYPNFVRSISQKPVVDNFHRKYISGEEASKLYLEEIKESKDPVHVNNNLCEAENVDSKRTKRNSIYDYYYYSTNLFVIAQNNDVDKLKPILDSCPGKVNAVDEFGWSLLMIACQANSIEIVQELLRKGADVTVTDKAGNSAQSLIIKNKNYTLADLLFSHRHNTKLISKTEEVELREVFQCDVCNKTFPDKEEHLSSTIHNISASSGKKIRANYVIPQSNKGYQIMLKTGWDKDSGLGPNGLGKQYPIKTVPKKDRKGLGHEKRKFEDTKQDIVKHKNRKLLAKSYHDNKKFEMDFRREFY